MYYIYILECSNGNYYTGYTTDIARRYQEHVSGSPKCKYTRAFPPRRLAACWRIEAPVTWALRLEAAIKQRPRQDKQQLCLHPQSLASLLALADPLPPHEALDPHKALCLSANKI